MEPRQSAPRSPYEAMPPYQGEVQQSHDKTGEHLNDSHFEVAVDRPVPIETEGLPPVLPAMPIAIPAVQADSTQSPATDSSSTNPAVAADEDLIEKEWVDKAKKIIEETKEDPYRRELEIGKLQRDYIRKRYGREIGETGSP